MKSRILTLTAIFTLLALLSSTAIVFADSPSQPKIVGSQWAVYEEKTLPNGNLNFYPAAHDTTFAMPDATAASPTFVNYMLDTFTTSLSESNTISASFTIDASSGATLMGNPLWTTVYGSPTTPAFVRLFFQSNLPNDGSASCVPGNDNNGNYWWAVNAAASYTFTTGTGSEVIVTLTATLSPSNWSGICGNGASSTPGFDNALANVKDVGLSFGSGYFYASGVGVDGASGSATFQLNSYTIS